MDDRYEEIIAQGVKRLQPKPGAVFGRLTVLGRAGKDRKGQALFSVVCACGTAYDSYLSSIRLNKLGCKSCQNNNALVAEVFNGDRRLYLSCSARLRNIVRRCMDPTAKDYANYGARGVKVCQAWVDDNNAFFRYVATLEGFSEAFSRRLQIDRIDNDKGYEPGNIRFATVKTNSRNRRLPVLINHQGRDYRVWEFHEAFCPRLPYKDFYTLVARFKRDAERLIEANGKYTGKIKP